MAGWQALTEEQKATSLQAVMAWQAMHLENPGTHIPSAVTARS